MDDYDSNESKWARFEDELIVRWRTERLLALGYGLRQAASLALSPIDIHELERLIGKGCPPETAIKIAA